MTNPTSTASVAAPASIAETLRLAKARIDTPYKWTTGAYASTTKRNSGDHEVNVFSPNAKYFCALGALRLVDGPFEIDATELLADAIWPRWRDDKEEMAHSVIYNYNDAPGRRHKQIMAAFDKAIAAAARVEAQS